MNRSGWSRLDAVRSEFERLLDELTGAASGRQRRGWAAEPEAGVSDTTQAVPVNVFETDTELMVVAAMPGIEPPNVEVTVEDNRLTIHGEKRGPGQERMRYHLREWTYGAYERTIDLPIAVDGERATATYGNGIVTIAFPKAAPRKSRKIEIRPESA